MDEGAEWCADESFSGSVADGVDAVVPGGVRRLGAGGGRCPAHQGRGCTAAKEVLHRLGNKPIENKQTGIMASVSKCGHGKLISSQARRLSEANGYTTEEHLLAGSNVEQLFQNSVLSETRADHKGDLPSVKLFSSHVVLGQKTAVACFTVKKRRTPGIRSIACRCWN